MKSETNNNTSRRSLLASGLSAGLLLGAGAGAVNASSTYKELDLETPTGILKNYVKLLGALTKSVIYVGFEGSLIGIMPDKTPVDICGFKGLARMQWVPQKDGSFLRKSFDIGYFSDRQTGELLDNIVNPLTGKTVKPFHYQYGGRASLFTERGVSSLSEKGEANEAEPYDLDWRSAGNQIWLTESGSGEFPAPLMMDEWPRESAGEVFRYKGDTTYVSTKEQLTDSLITQADYSLFWSSIISWEPWLEMEGAPGYVMWRGVGSKLRSYKDADPQLIRYIRSVQGNYFDKDDPWDGFVSNYDRFKSLRKPAHNVDQR